MHRHEFQEVHRPELPEHMKPATVCCTALSHDSSGIAHRQSQADMCSSIRHTEYGFYAAGRP
jgi:hypothetical protein